MLSVQAQRHKALTFIRMPIEMQKVQLKMLFLFVVTKGQMIVYSLTILPMSTVLIPASMRPSHSVCLTFYYWLNILHVGLNILLVWYQETCMNCKKGSDPYFDINGAAGMFRWLTWEYRSGDKQNRAKHEYLFWWWLVHVQQLVFKYFQTQMVEWERNETALTVLQQEFKVITCA